MGSDSKKFAVQAPEEFLKDYEELCKVPVELINEIIGIVIPSGFDTDSEKFDALSSLWTHEGYASSLIPSLRVVSYLRSSISDELDLSNIRDGLQKISQDRSIANFDVIWSILESLVQPSDEHVERQLIADHLGNSLDSIRSVIPSYDLRAVYKENELSFFVPVVQFKIFPRDESKEPISFEMYESQLDQLITRLNDMKVKIQGLSDYALSMELKVTTLTKADNSKASEEE